MNKTRRQLLIASVVLTAAGIFGLTKAREIYKTKNMPLANARLGMNLSGIADWSTEFPFVDLFKQSRTWFVEGKEPESSGLDLDEHGWVKTLSKGMTASTILSVIENEEFPGDDYVILYDGEGDIEIPHYTVKESAHGRILVYVDGTKGIFRLNITKTNPNNYIKNIRVVAKVHEKTYQQAQWNPSFLKRWAGVACLRFMDFMQTNNSLQKAWSDRPKPTDASFASKGVPVEWLVDLANRLNCDTWFCMPHQADDGYVQSFAQYTSQHLKPALHAWVEYSNEVWNGGFEQFSYAAEKGKALKLASDEWESAFSYNAKRAVEIFKIWKTVFGDNERLVRVVASQAANDWLAKQILKQPDIAEHADVLAIAPYISLNVPLKEGDEGLSADKVAAWSLNQLFEHITTVRLPEAKGWINANKEVADDYGFKLVAYEGGQHLVGVGEAANNDKLTNLLTQANADKRMGEVYAMHLKDWESAGGDLFCHFTSVEGWSKWGSWGLFESANKPTPKYRAVVKWAQSRDQKIVIQ